MAIISLSQHKPNVKHTFLAYKTFEAKHLCEARNLFTIRHLYRAMFHVVKSASKITFWYSKLKICSIHNKQLNLASLSFLKSTTAPRFSRQSLVKRPKCKEQSIVSRHSHWEYILKINYYITKLTTITCLRYAVEMNAL